MRIIGCCILVLVLALICVGVASANPGGGVKSSPLFKASLVQSIARLEGRVQRETVVGNEDEDMPTARGKICPNLPLTQQETYCTETCYAYSTCASTCANTCVGDPGSCKDYGFYGSIWWSWGGQSSTDWTDLPGGYQLTNSAVGVQFDDESSFHSVGSFGESDGAYSGVYRRTTTVEGHQMIAAANINNGYVYNYNYNTVYTSSPPGPSNGASFGIYY